MKIAIPNKGRLKDPALSFIVSAGITPMASDDRSLIIPTNWEGVELVFIRTEDIPSVVESGGVDLGITGLDYVSEAEADVEELLRLDFGNSKIVLAAPSGMDMDRLQTTRHIRIATKYYNVASKYVKEKGLSAKIVKISGAAEAMPLLGAADAIIDVMSTGTTLKLHGLHPIDLVMESHAVVIAARNWRKSENAPRITMIVTMMRGALEAKGKKLVMMNVPDDRLGDVIKSLPAMSAPAVSKLSSGDMWEVITVATDKRLAEIVTKAKEKGARDIIVVDIEKVIG